MRINYVTNAELCEIIRENLYKIPHDIDGVICIPRGGLFVGCVVAEFLHKPIYTIDTFLAGFSLGHGACVDDFPIAENKKYVVIDDSTTSAANSMRVARKRLSETNASFVYVACVCDSDTQENVDIVLSSIPQFRLFELNLFRSAWVRHFIFDIDGVLCKDPDYGIDMNEEAYIQHMLTAPPKFLPQYRVMALCTHRLLKYAKYTEEWLKSNSVEYGTLWMLDFESMEEKVSKLNTNEYLNMKSDTYKKYGSEVLLFVESNWDESVRIYNNTHKPVLCTDKNILLQD